jgi:hypothetical protein
MWKPEPYFSLVEKGLSTQQVVVVLVASGLLRVEGIDESGGVPCKDYTDTLTSSSQFFPRQHCWKHFYPLYPSYFFVSSFPRSIAWPWESLTAHCVHPTSR